MSDACRIVGNNSLRCVSLELTGRYCCRLKRKRRTLGGLLCRTSAISYQVTDTHCVRAFILKVSSLLGLRPYRERHDQHAWWQQPHHTATSWWASTCTNLRCSQWYWRILWTCKAPASAPPSPKQARDQAPRKSAKQKLTVSWATVNTIALGKGCVRWS